MTSTVTEEKLTLTDLHCYKGEIDINIDSGGGYDCVGKENICSLVKPADLVAFDYICGRLFLVFVSVP